MDNHIKVLPSIRSAQRELREQNITYINDWRKKNTKKTRGLNPKH